MDILHSIAYNTEEDQLRERTKYSQMDKLLIPIEFQQQPVSTGVRCFLTKRINLKLIFRQHLLLLNMMEE